MSASEHDAQPRRRRLPGPSAAVDPAGLSHASDPARPSTLANLSMSDLLASCAAASAVSTPPRDPAPRGSAPTERRPSRCSGND
ncbi:hypothetical protein AB0N81_27360 [Streptomyces sp. NPDC093510]|uniref:hypothetical protein n=1 Tax=Streptomyces sp. NPDC093510 TaxID=3155199 RepID=UPI003424A248